jgi:hypothetical protein
MREHGLATAGASEWRPAPVVLLPEQYFGEGAEAARAFPEQRLGFAVLELAVFEAQKGWARGGGRAVREVERWIASDDVGWPFSFRNLCETLEVDPVSLRRRLWGLRDVAGGPAGRGIPRRVRRIPIGRTRTISRRRGGAR